MKGIIRIFCGLLFMLPAYVPADDLQTKDQKVKDSYSLGYEFGSNLKLQELELDQEVVVSALREALYGKEPRISREEMRDNLLRIRKQVIVTQDRRARERAARNLAEGKAFLESNKSKEGVKSLPSGLQYKILRQGSGTIPKMSDLVKVHYRGTLIDGNEFDNSRHKAEPVSLSMSGVIKGWAEALQQMPTGSLWQLFVPPDLGYGARQFGRIPPNSTLVFEVELLGITDGPSSEPSHR